MSRKEKFGSRGTGRQPEKAAKPSSIGGESTDVGPLPPRSKKFPSSNQTVTKWYYNLLFFLFVCLVGGLFWYGLKFSE
ncbi:hypothetical protein KP806_05260 [Paenibacillus sp. N4]|uniref:hypothetical protein n=1 Tax=Paenibacillus vietnamensis TaxID=2590547 RepID=UPI001CD16629|nr:hypothetical protein [Paenibacillus vietnamensis]MCA0754449.1 hypothetical protein [Paenibacillus vietnamensis]